jgi:polar amino acid transport system substrate-binding protein
MLLTLAVAVTAWLWALAGVLFAIRWNSVPRPEPSARALFPYGEMRIGIDASSPPFAVATADDLFGLEIDLGRALAEALGIPARFVNMGYDGLYDSLRADQVDVVIAQLTYDPQLTASARYTRPYYNAGLVLVSPAARPLRAMTDLPGHALAYEFGAEADSEARRWLRRVLPFDQRPYELPAYALDAVRLGQADAALVDATSARIYQRTYSDWQVETNPVTDSLYVIASRADRPALAARVDSALAALEADGLLAQMIDKWF